MSVKENTAVLLFTRSVSAEARVKQLTHGRKHARNRHLIRTMIEETKSEIQRSGLPVFISNSDTQQGADFGEKFRHAVADVFDKGFSRVIVVGNDTPTLHRSDIRSAANLLKKNDLVLGPSTDGGAYLIGCTKQWFEQCGFEGLHWEKPSFLLSALTKNDRLGLDRAMLRTLSDVDTARDWTHLRSASFFIRIIQRLLHILDGSARSAIEYVMPYRSTRTGDLRALRAPPVRR